MSKKKYIKATNQPPTLPIFSTATVWLIVDRLQLTGVTLGVVWTVWGILLLLWVGNFIWKITSWESADPVYKDEG
jgi:hypothetical protein